jgi:hypothetical protein
MLLLVCISRSLQETYPADDVVVICKVSLALLAAKDFVGVQVDVVRKTHVCQNHFVFAL